jgi:type II secretory pathway predicted ATPase ExeA
MYPVDDQSPKLLADASASHAVTSASLTYEPFYGLHEKPFSLSADPRFLFRSSAHGPAFDELQAGIQRREGLIVLTGEIGAGKTTLCRSVLQHLDRRTFASFVADPFVSREDLLKTLLVDFGVISIGDLTRGRFSGASRSDLSYPLYEFLDSLVPLQAFAVVVIDEAQNLSLPLLEEIRILSELERREKLLQVVLVGQPELRSNLRLPEMRQVDQRVSVRCELASLDAAGAAGYVDHRLSVAGRGESTVVFTRLALEAIYEGSSGIPRLINRICDRALQRAFASRTMQIDAEFVWRAIDDLGLSTAIKVPDRALHQKPAAAIPSPTVADVPAAELPAPFPEPTPASFPEPKMAAPIRAAGRPARVAATQVSPLPELDLSGLSGFNTEDESSSEHTSIERSRSRFRWVAGAAAVLAASASIGAPAWYSRAQVVDGQELAAMVPPRPAFTLPKPAVLSLPVEAPSLTSSLPQVPVSAAVPTVRSAAPKSHNGYSIVVASFQNRDRAERLVSELVNAGYGARTVDRDGGPAGRLVQVQISGYTSAIDVQRDLQRIRELPGGYGDARVVPHP